MPVEPKKAVTRWQHANFREFWSSIATGDHLVQVYDHERTFMNTLEGYAGTALLQGEAVILIATGSHLQALAERLSAQGFDLRALRASGKFHPLDARAVLNKFMVDGMPDGKLFFSVIGKVIRKSHGAGGRIRAFGEMVVLLWEEGNQKAALKLEQLWNLFMEQNRLTLLCAYPSSILGKAGLKSVCCAHSKQIGGWPHASTEVFYKKD